MGPVADTHAPRRWWTLLAAVAVARFGHAALAAPYPDEVYHWVLSGHLAPAFLDHPGLTHALAGLGVELLGRTPLGLRLGTVVLSLAWLALVPALVRRLGLVARTPAGEPPTLAVGTDAEPAPAATAEDRPSGPTPHHGPTPDGDRPVATVRPAAPSAQSLALLLTALAPAVLAGSVLAVPYAPLLLGWSACLLAVLHAEDDDPSAPTTGRQLLAWCGAGAAAALAGWSQASAPLLLAVVGLWLLLARPRALGRPGPWLGLAVAAALLAPLGLWSARHGGAPWAFQLSGRHETGWHPEHGAELLLAQLVLVGPLLGLWLPLHLRRRWALARGPAGRDRDVSRLVLVSAAVVLLPFAVQALTAERWLPHWTLPAYALLLPDAAASLGAASRTWRRLVVGTSAVLAAALVAVHVAAGHPAALELVGDPFRMAQHDELAATVAREWARLPEPRVLLTADYQTGSLLQWWSGAPGPLAEVALPPAAEWSRNSASGPDYPRLFPVPAAQRGWHGLYVGRRRSGRTRGQRRAGLEAAFERVLDVDDVPERFTVLRCEGFVGR